MMLWRQKLPSKDLSQRKQNMTMQKRFWIRAAFHAKPCWQKKRISMNSLRRSISRSGKSAGSSSNARKSRRRQSSCSGTSTVLNSSHSVCLTHGSSKARRANVCGFAGPCRSVPHKRRVRPPCGAKKRGLASSQRSPCKSNEGDNP